MLEETKQATSQDPKTQLDFWNGGKSERQIIKESIAKAFKVVGRSQEAEEFSGPGPIDIGEIMKELGLKPTNEPLPTEVVVDIVHAKHMAAQTSDSDTNKKRKL